MIAATLAVLGVVLYLVDGAFDASTAFSPTDTAVLSRQAKPPMMSPSPTSLLVVVVLAARAVGTL